MAVKVTERDIEIAGRRRRRAEDALARAQARLDKAGEAYSQAAAIADRAREDESWMLAWPKLRYEDLEG